MRFHCPHCHKKTDLVATFREIRDFTDNKCTVNCAFCMHPVTLEEFKESLNKKYRSMWTSKSKNEERSKMLKELGGKCVECGITDKRVLHIHHEGKTLVLLCANHHSIRHYLKRNKRSLSKGLDFEKAFYDLWEEEENKKYPIIS